jgi:hypothetical protein
MGLSVFFAVIFCLGESFRGYQAEVRLRGAASEELDVQRLRDWVTRNDPSAALAVSTKAGGDAPVEIRVGRIASRLNAATGALDALAQRILTQELPEQRAVRRGEALASLQAELRLAREAEESLRTRAAGLRDQVAIFETPVAESPSESSEIAREVDAPTADAANDPGNVPTDETPANLTRERLETLRLELAKLLASHTDEHPQVLAVRRQIESLQRGSAADTAPSAASESGPALMPSAATRAAPFRDRNGSSFVSTTATNDASLTTDLVSLRAELAAVEGQLVSARSRRDRVESDLHAKLASFSAAVPASAWSVEPARIVARLGGTPRMLPVMIAMILGLVASVLTFRASREPAGPKTLKTAGELQEALPIPVVGNWGPGTANRIARSGTILTPARLRIVTKFAEGWLLTILAICVVAIVLDPTLAGQFAGDPLGVLSEIQGRLMGR